MSHVPDRHFIYNFTILDPDSISSYMDDSDDHDPSAGAGIAEAKKLWRFADNPQTDRTQASMALDRAARLLADSGADAC